jgi:hypothetical protein
MSQTEKNFISMAQFEEEEDSLIEGYRGEADANAGRVALPHDWYRGTVAFGESDPDKRWQERLQTDQSGNVVGKYFMASVQFKTAGNADETVNGNIVDTMITTAVFGNGGTTSAQALLQGLGVDTINIKTHKGQALAVNNALASEVYIGCQLDVEATVFDKEAAAVDKKGQPVQNADGTQKMGRELARVKGYRKFPLAADGVSRRFELTAEDGLKDMDGNLIPASFFPVNGRNFVRRWKNIKDMGAKVEQVAADNAPQAVAAQPGPVPVSPAPKPPTTPPSAPRTVVRRVA